MCYELEHSVVTTESIGSDVFRNMCARILALRAVRPLDHALARKHAHHLSTEPPISDHRHIFNVHPYREVGRTAVGRLTRHIHSLLSLGAHRRDTGIVRAVGRDFCGGRLGHCAFVPSLGAHRRHARIVRCIRRLVHDAFGAAPLCSHRRHISIVRVVGRDLRRGRWVHCAGAA